MSPTTASRDRSATLFTATPVRDLHCRPGHQQADTPVPHLRELICSGVAMINLSVFLNASAEIRPGAVALRCGEMTTGFSVLSSEVAWFADYLIDTVLRLDDRVAVMLPNHPELAVAFYGVLQAGGVVVLMSPSLSANAVECCLTITGRRCTQRYSGQPTGVTWISVHCGCAFRALRCRPIRCADSRAGSTPSCWSATPGFQRRYRPRGGGGRLPRP
jgi:hypothetical protein